MFTLAKSPSYWWPVVVVVPGDDGQVITSQFDGLFKRLSPSEHEAQVSKIRAATPEQPYGDVQMARDLMEGWRGVVARDGGEIQFTDGTFGQLLDLPGAATAIVKAYNGSLRKAAEKN
jgi:hypothetical protein